MKGTVVVAALLVIPMMILSAWAIAAPSGGVEPLGSSIMAEPPDYVSGYGFDPLTQTMQDTNGFRYSYQPDGIIQLDLPWGYTTHFSFGLTADYLGSPEKRTALDYTWAWDTEIGLALNETGNLTGYTYAFVATSQDGVLGWEIRLDFSPTSRMKVTHTLTNGYAQTLTDVNFWYLFDLRGTATPYTIETSAGIVEGPLYQAIPDGIHWVRLGNQFQFDWRDALADYENGNAYIGDGSVVGLDGLPILGISIKLGGMAPGATVIIDPYFSGVELTWDAGSDGLASTPANWSPVQTPDTGDNITFDATSVFNCDWNLEKTLGNFSMLTGYTGTVTQSVDFGCVDFALSAGTFLGQLSPVLWLDCEGNFTASGSGVLSANKLHLNMTGSDTIVTMNSPNAFETLRISNDITVNYPGGLLRSNRMDIGEFSVDVTATTTFVWKAFLDYTYSNLGTIEGDGLFGVFLLNVDHSIDIGTVLCSTKIILQGGAISPFKLTLTAPTIFGDALLIDSEVASAFEVDIGNNALSVAGVFTLDTRSTFTQGTGVCSFGSYAQTGVDSVFNQGATLTIGGDFTVSDGAFNAVGDMTVPGDWDTATGSYLNDDNVVTLTGASKTLAMHANDSFYNVTVSGTYTMDTDTTVRLRATISGTVDGTGDFIEPLPEFTNDGWPHACPMELYEHTPTQLYWDTLDLVDPPYWLHLIDGVVTGVPNDNDTGLYEITLTLTWNDMVTYQNYTLIVCPELLSEADITMLGVGLSIVLGFGLIVIGFAYKMPHLIVFSGLIWLISAVTVYKDISVEWTIITLGLGVMILAGGGFQLVDQSEK